MYRGRERATGREVAVKRALTEDDGAEGVPGTFLREASVLRLRRALEAETADHLYYVATRVACDSCHVVTHLQPLNRATS